PLATWFLPDGDPRRLCHHFHPSGDDDAQLQHRPAASQGQLGHGRVALPVALGARPGHLPPPRGPGAVCRNEPAHRHRELARRHGARAGIPLGWDPVAGIGGMPMSRIRRRSNPQSGFTLLEAMIAIVIMSFGILSLAAVYAQGIQVANMTQMDYIAEKKAEEAVETIFAARDSHLLLWTNIRNVTGLGGGDDGVFLVQPQPLLAAGPDGLYGTLDDDKSNPDVVILDPGLDKILGTSDDV